MPFKSLKNSSTSIDTPEALFQDLRTRKIPGLLAHQADVLRAYVESASAETDVAFQLPTGSGKTLIGLVLGEWRRKKFGERVVYLCPTNQLVHQVAHEALGKYGLKVNSFTGKKSEYDAGAKGDYQSADTIAITSYSSLFNINPFFADPHTIILDDAHAAESYIASQWSLRIERHKKEHSALYIALANLIRPFIPLTDHYKITGRRDGETDKVWADKIPTPIFFDMIPDIIEIVDTYVEESDLKYSWYLIRDHLYACHFYIGSREFLIRPLLAPTNTHTPFANADQRIYMSATLGEGGELERLTGRKHIKRLQMPAGWDKQGIGRRLFFFPGRSLNESDSESLVLNMMEEAGRSLVIVPDDPSADRIRKLIIDRISFTTFTAKEIESSKQPFISSDKAVAVVSNRYDGIDFPNDECRLLVIEGTPQATNLQERFIVSKMGAGALLQDRILTRIQQAFGRCTRSATDYAAVIIWKDGLNSYLLKREQREFLHPEIQAELQFGIDQSKEVTSSDFVDNFKIFLSQDKDWNDADENIVAIRQQCAQKILPGTKQLHGAVSFEIDYQYAMWKGDFAKALECCRKVLTELTDSELQGYRALWNYLAGSAAWLSTKHGLGNLDSISRSFYSAAMSGTSAIRWLVDLSRYAESSVQHKQDNSLTITLIERLEQILEELGVLSDRKFETNEKFILQNIQERDKERFESAHSRLGWLLGFDSGNKETTGAPDPWWIVNERLCFIFEDHSNADKDSSLSVTKARQAATHPNWVKANLPVNPDADIFSILITPVKVADLDAFPHLKDVFVWDVDDFRHWAVNALATIRELRRSFPGPGDLIWRTTAIEKYTEAKIAPNILIEFLNARPASTTFKSSDKNNSS